MCVLELEVQTTRRKKARWKQLQLGRDSDVGLGKSVTWLACLTHAHLLQLVVPTHSFLETNYPHRQSHLDQLRSVSIHGSILECGDRSISRFLTRPKNTDHFEACSGAVAECAVD